MNIKMLKISEHHEFCHNFLRIIENAAMSKNVTNWRNFSSAASIPVYSYFSPIFLSAFLF